MADLRRAPKPARWNVNRGSLDPRFAALYRHFCLFLPFWEDGWGGSGEDGPRDFISRTFCAKTGTSHAWTKVCGGTALELDGTSGDYFDFASNLMGRMPLNNEPWSVIFWCAPGSQIGNHNNVFLNWGGMGTDNAVFLGMDSSQVLRTDFWSNDHPHTGTTYPAGEEVVLIITHDPVDGSTGKVRSYKNGVLAFTATLTRALSTDAGNVRIGAWDVGNGREWVGKMLFMGVMKGFVIQPGVARMISGDPAGFLRIDPGRLYRWITPPAAGGDITVSNPIASATVDAVTEFLLSQIPPVASGTVDAVTEFLLSQIPPVASGTGSAVNPTVSIAVVVANPVAAGTGSATTTFLLSQVPTPVATTASAVTEFILSQIPPVSSGTGSAVNPTAQIGIVVTPPAASGSATATTQFVLSQVPSAAAAVASGATTLVLSVTPAQAEAIISGVNPDVVFPGTEAAYVIVLDGVVFILDVNVPKAKSLTVEDTELTETGMTPGWAGWLTNKPRIRSKKVQE